MSKIIQFKTKPFNMLIAFEITGIEVRSTSQDPNASANVNGVDVWETYNEIVYRLRELCDK